MKGSRANKHSHYLPPCRPSRCAVLYGRGSSGGLINSISKKPSFTPEREVGMNFDSEDKRRTQFDTGWAAP
ncbi:hypothetical protein EQ845_01640 [Pseudomonas putida]|nr:hypothetical protein EQ845_01640 [Pseudomonas putida]